MAAGASGATVAAIDAQLKRKKCSWIGRSSPLLAKWDEGDMRLASRTAEQSRGRLVRPGCVA